MEILTFLSRHHPPPIDMKKAIHRVSRNVMWRIRTLVEGTDTGRDSLGKQSRRKRIIQPFIIFYSLAQDQEEEPPGPNLVGLHSPSRPVILSVSVAMTWRFPPWPAPR